MGSSGSVPSQPGGEESTGSNTFTFRAQDLRAPIFAKQPSEKIDFKANHKYCNEEIIKNWFKFVDADGSGDITFEEYKKSQLAINVTEEIARENFNRMDTDGNHVVDFSEFRTFHLNAGLVAPDQSGTPSNPETSK
uniref:EF-hand domain-containing protein n=1 Tax=Cryptomonas curvata TaxID=233186 RepID=A0A7S0QB59_9CRYP|mmetsp:Transcript_12405/g.26640  ORF Transcript_12405/g.26640 Transcript_12405/m.26640 type:complete len:136 (+) Transcript_12405:82-489(+)|eukprot:CAMPEP_0172165492 /NCGR_PEP_ID=MMETSP1050-20130122/8443_1 /TAXON_ID=233186 /ORGANISM="Cryptomonas curvata, Strain CCAP979/52" /LENGTH=135 /DNA_ID=CAMNT_0012835971 /DNA_START=80 /DNA_END=487 /DNA_ORIENTATION=+